MAAATKSKPKPAAATGKAPSRKGQPLKRWTTSEARRMVKEVSEAPRGDKARVYADWAAKRGIRPDAVQAKYYAMKRKAGKRGRRAAGTAATAATGVAAAASSARARVAGSSVDVRSLSTLELTRLVRAATNELESRINELQRLWK
jgi:hypothetical protein